jgi:hypothetical protein
MTRNDNNKIALVNPKTRETPLVKEELPVEGDVSH